MATKKKGGRPTVYDRSVLDKAEEYIWFFQLSEEERNNLQDSKINPTENIPTVSGLALYLGLARSTVQEWEKSKDHEFSGTLEKLKAVQEVLILNNGLIGKFNPTIAKLALANHGYSDKQEMDVTTNGESFNKPTIINLVGKSE